MSGQADAASGVLRELFRHHEWATLALIDHCGGLGPELLASSAAGTRGPILETIEHTVAADQRYQGRFGVEPDPVVREGDGASLAVMRAAFARQAAQWQSIIDRLDGFDITLPADPRDDWPETPHAENLLLLQALHHGNDHRTHVCTILGSLGLAAPDLDGWTYWATNRTSR